MSWALIGATAIATGGSMLASKNSGGGFQSIPDSPEQSEARKFLLGLTKKNVQFPTRKIPGMTGIEAEGQQWLQEYLNKGIPSGITTGIGQLKKTVEGGYDPMTSPAYQGYREASKMEEEEAINELRRRLQLVGHGDFSSPALKQEGATRRGYSADRMGYLGALYDRERERQTGAAGPLIEASDYASKAPLRKTEAATAYGGLPRQIETAQDEADYLALLQTLLFPYKQEGPAGAAGTILGETRQMYDPGDTGPSTFSQIAGPAAMAMMLGGGGNIFSRGGGGMPTVGTVTPQAGAMYARY